MTIFHVYSSIFGVCSCRNIFSYARQIYDRLLIGLTLQKLIWNLISCYGIDTTWINFYLFTLVLLFVIRCRFPKSKSLASIVRSRYDNHILKIIRKYGKLDYRYRKLDLDIQFLDTCIRVYGRNYVQISFNTRFQINDCKLPIRQMLSTFNLTRGNNI